ncbi:MAG: hypothetical protein LLG04_14630 [Parachlamydia sp.]|nr:hypothetical protein [Parachlamydia sp.]
MMAPLGRYDARESNIYVPPVQSQKEVIEDSGKMATETPPADSALTLRPSLQSQMIAHQVSKAFEKQEYNTSITEKEFQEFHAFWQDWLKQPVPTNWSSLDDFYLAREVFGSRMEDLYKLYLRLKPIYNHMEPHKISANDINLRQQFAFNLGMLAHLFGLLCDRDAGLQERPQILKDLCGVDPGFAFGSSSLAYKQHYQQKIHAHFLIFQRFANFLHAFLEKEGAAECKHPYDAIEVQPRAYLAFLQDGNGYVPVSYACNPQTFEVTNVTYGESALPKLGPQYKVFLVDHGTVITQSGFLVEMMKVLGQTLVSVKGFYGEDTATPLLLTLEEQYASTKAPVVKIQILMASIADVMTAFEKSEEIRDFCFIPLPQQGMESKEFAYCFLQEIIIRSKIPVRPEEQKQAAEWLRQIEQIEGKPAEELVKELEAEIKTEYAREVQEQQRLRTQQVITGTTPGAGLTRKERKTKARKQEKAQQVAKKEPPPKTVDQKVEEAFQNLKVNGRIKFRKMMKMAQNVLKLHPDTLTKVLKDEKQQGSHHVLHMEQGTATIVHPHGRQDKTISPKSANRFLGAIFDQMKKTMTS